LVGELSLLFFEVTLCFMRKYKVNGLDTGYSTDDLNDLSLAAIYNLGIGS